MRTVAIFFLVLIPAMLVGWLPQVAEGGEQRKIDAIDVAYSGKTVTPQLLEAVQLTHRSDMDLADAMQNTKRCQRMELDASQQPISLQPYSITRVKLARP